jgi:type IV secretory pathway VirB10-like protein
MAPDAELPPMKGDTTRKDPSPAASTEAERSSAPESPSALHDVGHSQFTHESKVPPLRLEGARPQLARGPTVFAIGGLLSVIALSMVFAFSSPPPPAKTAESAPDQPAVSQTVQLPDVIQEQPGAPAPDGGIAEQQAGPFRRDDTDVSPRADEGEQTQGSLRRAHREALREEAERALGSSLYANIDDPFAAEQRTAAPSTGSLDAMAAARAATPGASPASLPSDQNLQGRKNEFLTQTDRSDGYLANQLVRPRSPYELKAGTIIPTVLVTGINSDLPGTILGQVRENVYDTVSGNYLLVPQGSKLLASYDSMIAYGQERVLVCWQRLIRPDGTSLSLDCQPGIDLSGYSGFSDQVDNHWWRVLTGVALGSVLAAGVVVPQGNVSGYVPTIGQGMAANAAGAINQAGQQITTRALNIQPTIKIRPGFSVNVLVTKDLVIPPYRLETGTQ